MDPVSALSLAANITQFLTLGIHVGKRINGYTSTQSRIPEEFRDALVQVDLMIDVLSNMQPSIEDHGNNLPQHSLDRCNKTVTERVKRLNNKLDKFLPRDDDLSWKKTKKAISSIDKGAEMKTIAKGLDRYVSYLTLYQVTLRPGLSHAIKATNYALFDVPA
ncbi:MAG: hypothetical protein Q9222_005735 [Ikaeria aurantiellina]